MLTDAWLTDNSDFERCPLCSQPLTGGSNTCLSCGFTAHEPAGNALSPARLPAFRQPNPITPIPARASAQRARSRPGVIPRRTTTDAGATLSSSPSLSSAQQGGGWQHESPSYEVASSLSSLSLLISETPTAPPRTSPSTRHLEQIDEIDTVPQQSGQTRAVRRRSDYIQAISPDLPETPLPSGPLALRFDDLDVSHLAVILSETTPPVPHVDEIDTVPEAGSTSVRSLMPLQSASREVAVDAASWTAASGSTRSLAARFIASRSPRRRHTRIFNPLDRTRWWLLRPGHIEFLLWTVGSLLLFGVTFLILLATVLSLMLPALQGSGNFPISTVKASTASPAATLATSNGLHLTLSGKTPLPPGVEMHLQGEGFRPHSTVVFLLDGRLPLLDQYGKAASIQTDASGRFAVNLWLGQGPGWSAGSHQILARETVGGRQVTVAITISSASRVSGPGAPGGVQSTPVPPVNPTPQPARPTPTPVSATPTPKPPAATPTPGVTSTPASTPTSTGGATATPGLSGGSLTPAPGQTPGSSALGNSLNNEDGNSLLTRLAHLNPLVWLIGVCYFASMLLLGMAGLLRRRHR